MACEERVFLYEKEAVIYNVKFS